MAHSYTILANHHKLKVTFLRGVWSRTRAWISPASAAHRLARGGDGGGGTLAGAARRLGPGAAAANHVTTCDDFLTYSSSSRGRDLGPKGQSTDVEWTRAAIGRASYVPAPRHGKL